MTADFAPDGTWTWRGYTFSIPRAVVEQWEEGQKVSYLLRIAHPNPWQQQPQAPGGSGRRTTWATAIIPWRNIRL